MTRSSELFNIHILHTHQTDPKTDRSVMVAKQRLDSCWSTQGFMVNWKKEVGVSIINLSSSSGWPQRHHSEGQTFPAVTLFHIRSLRGEVLWFGLSGGFINGMCWHMQLIPRADRWNPCSAVRCVYVCWVRFNPSAPTWGSEHLKMTRLCNASVCGLISRYLMNWNMNENAVMLRFGTFSFLGLSNAAILWRPSASHPDREDTLESGSDAEGFHWPPM